MIQIGYTFTGYDNDTYMFEDDSCLDKCPACGYRTEFIVHNPKYALGRKGRNSDISATYDGQLIVSKKFRDICVSAGVRNVIFDEFENEPNFFHLNVTEILRFNPDCAKTRFIKKCSVCGNFESVVGIKPACFFVDGPVPFGIYRSDVAFASGNEKHPLIVISFEIFDIFNQAGLKGLAFAAAYKA